MTRRREFLIGSVGILGAALSRVAGATPCPPSPFLLDGGSESVATGCSASGAPAWFASMPTNTWATPVTNVLSNVRPSGPAGSQQAVVSAWCGMLSDPTRRTVALLANGGHSDYQGNEVYALNLGAVSPAWDLRKGYTGTSPLSSHTYHNLTCVHPWPITPNSGRWVIAGVGATWQSGSTGESQWWELTNPGSSSTSAWVSRGSHTTPPYAGPNAAAFDPIGQQIIKIRGGAIGAGGAVDYYNASDLTTVVSTRSSILNDASNYMVSFVDTTNHIYVSWRADNPTQFNCLDLANKNGSITTVTATGTGPASRYPAYWWHAPMNCFLTWGGNGASGIKKLTPTVGGSSYTAMSFSDLPLGSGGVSQPSFSDANDSSDGGNLNGMFNKVGYIPDMGDGHGAIVCLIRFSGTEIYVYKL